MKDFLCITAQTKNNKIIVLIFFDEKNERCFCIFFFCTMCLKFNIFLTNNVSSFEQIGTGKQIYLC